MRKIVVLILVGSLLCGCGAINKVTKSEPQFIGKTWRDMEYMNLLEDFHTIQRNACLEGLDSVMLWLTLDMESSTQLERKLAVGALRRWTAGNTTLANKLVELEKLANGEEAQPLVDLIKEYIKDSKTDSLVYEESELPSDNEAKDLKVYTCLELAKQYYEDVQKLVDDGVFQWSENSIITMATFFATEEIAQYDKNMIAEVDKLLPVNGKIDVFPVYSTIEKWSTHYIDKVSKGTYSKVLK